MKKLGSITNLFKTNVSNLYYNHLKLLKSNIYLVKKLASITNLLTTVLNSTLATYNSRNKINIF